MQSPVQQTAGGHVAEIIKDTRVSDVLKEYGDIAEVMELLGVRRVARYSFRRMLRKAVTFEMAARVHRVPLGQFLEILHKAFEQREGK
jgi:hypothetical protein